MRDVSGLQVYGMRCVWSIECEMSTRDMYGYVPCGGHVPESRAVPYPLWPSVLQAWSQAPQMCPYPAGTEMFA